MTHLWCIFVPFGAYFTVSGIPCFQSSKRRSQGAVTKSRTGTWDLGRGDSGTWGRRDVGTSGRGDSGTWGLGDVGTWGRGDAGTWGRGDSGTRGLVNSGTCELGDVGTRRHIFEVTSPRKLNCLCYFAFQVPAKYTAKFKNWILEKSFSPPVTELECETKQKT